MVNVVVVLLLLRLLLSRCALGCWDPQYHQLNPKRLLLLRYVRWLLWLWHILRCQLTNVWCGEYELSII
jgi:hypothetical protein